jgi:hypothetical protein
MSPRGQADRSSQRHTKVGKTGGRLARGDTSHIVTVKTTPKMHETEDAQADCWPVACVSCDCRQDCSDLRRDHPAHRLPLHGGTPTEAASARRLLEQHGEPYLRIIPSGLRELGWVDGETISIEFRSADGQNERFVDLVDDLVRLPVDVIVTSSTPGALAAKERAGSVPVVVAIGGDPVALGLVPTLARPGGNITGVTSGSTITSAKRVELIKATLPRLSRLAIFAETDNPSVPAEMNETLRAATELGLQVLQLPLRAPGDIVGAFPAASGWHADAAILLPNACGVGPSARPSTALDSVVAESFCAMGAGSSLESAGPGGRLLRSRTVANSEKLFSVIGPLVPLLLLDDNIVVALGEGNGDCRHENRCRVVARRFTMSTGWTAANSPTDG